MARSPMCKAPQKGASCGTPRLLRRRGVARAGVFGALVAVQWLGANDAAAQLDVTELLQTRPDVVRALARSHARGSFTVRVAESESSPSGATASERSTFTETTTLRSSQGVAITERWAALPALGPAGASAATTTSAAERVFWSPPRRLLLDRAVSSIHLPQYVDFARSLGGDAATGAGVVIGTVDSGVDFAHPDLQNPDGTTRVAWFIDFADSPHGLYPELEEQFGCTGEEFSCGVLSASEINTLLENETPTDARGRAIALATDRLGHGTHVTSLAAGRGASSARYTGVAPEATLIVARVASVTSSVSDAGVLMATRFIFDRADEMAMPAVVNLSLGGDFGPHDGSSAIGQALEQLVEQPGRAIVVAAGNSGTLYGADTLPYPEPLGIHTEVHLPDGDQARVPMLLPRAHGDLTGAVYVWVGARDTDRITVGLESAGGKSVIPPVPPGGVAIDEGDDVTAIIVNRADLDELDGAEDYSRGAAIVLDGTFRPGQVYGIIVGGAGNAQLWVQSEGQLSPELSEGVVFPGATRSGTITIPAVSPELIAVGATVNRTDWPSRDDGLVSLSDLGGEWVVEGPAFFSSHGPNRAGHPKPDILAPGVALVGALAGAADPVVDGELNPLSIFGISNVCDESPGCSVVSDRYAVTLGTSMAAPIVSGAAALLLEQQPSLTQRELMTLIYAGARQTPRGTSRLAQASPGLLDVDASSRALAATRERVDLGEPSSQSWLSTSDTLARPDPTWPVIVRLHLRDSAGQLADAAAEDIELDVTHGRVVSVEHVAPGLFEWSVAPERRSAGKRLSLSARRRSQVLAEHSLPIGMDYNAASRGLSVRGGCGIAQANSVPWGWFFLVGVALGLSCRRVRARRAPRAGATKRSPLSTAGDKGSCGLPATFSNRAGAVLLSTKHASRLLQRH